jgi:hypothetical protein
MAGGHENSPRRVPCILGSLGLEAQLCWRDVSLSLDEIRDVEAAKTRFLIVYGKILVLPETKHQTDETCHNQGSLQRPTWRMQSFRKARRRLRSLLTSLLQSEVAFARMPVGSFRLPAVARPTATPGTTQRLSASL